MLLLPFPLNLPLLLLLLPLLARTSEAASFPFSRMAQYPQGFLTPEKIFLFLKSYFYAPWLNFTARPGASG